MKKLLLVICFFLLSRSQVFAGVETDMYCHEGEYGISKYTAKPLFEVNYGKEKKSIFEALRISYGQKGVSEGTGMLFYSVDGDNGFEVYQYNCLTHTPKKVTEINKRESERLWISTYSERYVVLGTSFPGLTERDWMESIYIYDMVSQKMVVKIPVIKRIGEYQGYGYDWANSVYKTKKGTFILSLTGDSELVRRTSVIEIYPRTGKITEL